MFRNHADSQSNVWNTVQSALSSKARQSLSIDSRSWCSDRSTSGAFALGSAADDGDDAARDLPRAHCRLARRT